MLNTNRELQDPSAKFVQHSKYRHICLIAGKQSGKYTGYLNTTLLFQDFCFHGTATKLGNNLWNDKKRTTNYHFLYLKTKLLLRLYNENFLQEILSFNIKKKSPVYIHKYIQSCGPYPGLLHVFLNDHTTTNEKKVEL